MTNKPQTWQWSLSRDHWIDLTLTDLGLSYGGTDWECQSGGPYMAGFQTYDTFLRDGPLNEMPDAIAQAVRAHIADRGTVFPLTVRIAGEVPQEIHFSVRNQSGILRNTSTVVEGTFPAGSYPISAMVMYDGCDPQGRRTMRTFSITAVLPGPAEVTIDELTPRFSDGPSVS